MNFFKESDIKSKQIYIKGKIGTDLKVVKPSYLFIPDVKVVVVYLPHCLADPSVTLIPDPFRFIAGKTFPILPALYDTRNPLLPLVIPQGGFKLALIPLNPDQWYPSLLCIQLYPLDKLTRESL